MKIVVTGATGLIGRALVQKLAARGDRVIALVRDPSRAKLEHVELVRADLEHAGPWCDCIDGADAVIHLAGEPIAGKRWDARQKQILRDSRVESGRTIVEAIASAAKKPRAIIGASGVDYYPFDHGEGEFADEPVTEIDPPGDGFLARLCVAWEREVLAAETHGVRAVCMRTGIVLAPDGGALARMTTPFKLFAGGKIGSGRQRVSWIQLDDIVAAYLAAIDDARYRGAINAVAGSVANADFARAIGRVLHRPALVPVPAFAIKLAAGGELAESILNGRNVVPAKLRELGFAFLHPDVADALACSLGHAHG
jgi:uncharacterized protein (TIGR01777 family)